MDQAQHKLYVKPRAKHLTELTHYEHQLIRRLRQLRNLGERRAVVELDAEAGPRVMASTGHSVDRSPAM